MGRVLKYRLGSFYRTSDRTGFPTRAENTRKQWDNLIVEEKTWEPRQPQDLVKGVPDIQSVPDARPLGQNVYVGPISVATTAAAVIGQTSIPVQTTFGFYQGAKVGCMTDQDGGAVFFTTIASPPTGFYLVLANPLPYNMASGNLITLYKSSPPPEPGLP